MILESQLKNENNEIFTTNFTLNGAEEDFSFLEMMDEIAGLKSPFFGMARKEHAGGTIISQIISGKLLSLPKPIGKYI